MIVFMAVGYALLSSSLNINGSTAVTSNWQVEFSDIRTISQKGGATNKVIPTITATTANFEVDLVQPGDEITYEIDITNYKKLCIYYNAENVETNVNIFACSNNQTQNIDLRDVDYYADVVENGEGLTQCIALDFDTMSCYPALASWSKDTGSGTTSYFTTIEMWFE